MEVKEFMECLRTSRDGNVVFRIEGDAYAYDRRHRGERLQLL